MNAKIKGYYKSFLLWGLELLPNRYWVRHEFDDGDYKLLEDLDPILYRYTMKG